MGKYYAINEESARHSHNMMSMRDYDEGATTAAYMSQVDEAYEIADKIAKERPRAAEKAYRLADRYSKRLAANVNTDSRIGMMCPSVMISGAGNFPVKKKEKQVAAWERNHKDYEEVQKIKDKLKNLLYGKEVILSGDEDAIERLEEKLESLIESQERMKAANAYYRKNGTLDGCPELTTDQIEKLKKEMATDWHYEDKPFATYALTNNNATIRNTKQRLEELKKKKEQGTQETENKFCRVVENTENMRLQLFFDGKPEEEVRAILKRNGFRWAPSQDAWQRQLTTNAKYALNRVLEELEKLETTEE